MIFCFFLQRWDYSVGNFMLLVSLNIRAFRSSKQLSLSHCVVLYNALPLSTQPSPQSPLWANVPECRARAQLPHSCFLYFPVAVCSLLHQVPIQWWWDMIDSRIVGISEAESPKSVALTEATSLARSFLTFYFTPVSVNETVFQIVLVLSYSVE